MMKGEKLSLISRAFLSPRQKVFVLSMVALVNLRARATTDGACALAMNSPAQIEAQLDQALAVSVANDPRLLSAHIRRLANEALKSKSMSDPLVLRAFARARELDSLSARAREHYEPTSRPIVALVIAPWQVGDFNHIVASAAVQVFEIERQPNHPEAYITVVDLEFRRDFEGKVPKSNKLIMPSPSAFDSQAQRDAFHDVIVKSKNVWEADIGRLPSAPNRFYFASQTTDGQLHESHPLSFRVNGEYRNFLDYLADISRSADILLLHTVLGAVQIEIPLP